MNTQFNRRLWVSVAIIFGSIIVASGVLFYMAGDIFTNVANITAARNLILQQTDAVATVAELDQNAAGAAPYQAAMDQLLPTQDGLIGFSGWMQKIGDADQVAVTTTFNPNSIPGDALVDSQDVSALGFSVQVQGSLAAIAAFMKDIQSQPGFFVRIDSFDVAGNGASDALVARGDVFFRQQ